MRIVSFGSICSTCLPRHASITRTSFALWVERIGNPFYRHSPIPDVSRSGSICIVTDLISKHPTMTIAARDEPGESQIRFAELPRAGRH